jgi:type VI secretion system secreted protein Hcp
MNAYLKLAGPKSGTIQGSVTQKGHEGMIAVIAATHEILTPRDPATGLPTGKRQHKPLTITKELDRSTPILRQVLVNNEVLKEAELQFFSMAKTGMETQYFTIRLSNASIASIEMQMPNNKHADLASLETFEDVTFTYQKIEWVWATPPASAMDDWMNPGA